MGLAIASVLDAPKALIHRIVRHPMVMWAIAVALFIALYNWTEDRPGVGTGGTAQFVMYGLVALFVLLPAAFGQDAGGVPRAVLRHPVLA